MGRLFLIVLTASALSACAYLPASEIEPTDFTLPEDWQPTDYTAAEAPAPKVDPDIAVQAAVDLLASGKSKLAREKLVAALDAAPEHARAAKLLSQIDQDPVTLLGAKHATYRVRVGDTLSEIARTRLGDSMLFYALSRYNDLDAPNLLKAGEVIKIPLRATANVAAPAQKLKAKPKPRMVVATAQSSPAPVVDREAAKSLKLEGLRKLNTGAYEQALSLFQQALAQDPTDESIRRHLATALDQVNAASSKTLRLEALQALNTGNTSHATSLLERAAVLTPGDPTIARDLARARLISSAGGGR